MVASLAGRMREFSTTRRARRQAQVRPGGGDHGVEGLLVEGSAFAAYLVRLDLDQPVEPDLARAALPVPVAGADVHPVPALSAPPAAASRSWSLLVSIKRGQQRARGGR